MTFLIYNVDIVICIDGSRSMGSIINNVKANALSFYQKFVDEMNAKGKSVQQLRIKVIVFRDYGVDSEPMVESKFFVLDDEEEDFARFVNGIEASGGVDAPENSLEALSLAMRSDWVKTGALRRHIIMLYTDNTALKLGERKGSPGYPSDMPANMAELRDYWDGKKMEKRAKRLLLFAPDVEPWSTDLFDWDSCFLITSKNGAGCDDTDIEQCIHILANSI